MKNLFLLMLLCLFCPFSGYLQAQQEKPCVLLVSFDGFRHDYVEKYDLPNFKAFISRGASAEYMIPSFPSKTFPNHYTLVTGLYPGEHGLVDNTFYDTLKDVVYTMGKKELVKDAHFYGGLPLWQLAQQQGLKSASYFWVGSEAPIAGAYPTYLEAYNESVPNEERIETVKNWLLLPADQRPHFVSLYFSLVDSEGHESGPNSEKLKKTVEKADQLLGLIARLPDETKLPLNIIITSDHGMYEMRDSPETLIFLGDLLGSTQARYVTSGAVTHIYEDNPDKREELYHFFSSKQQHFSLYRKEETPAEWHYRTHPRVGDLLLVAHAGHYFKRGRSEALKTAGSSAWGVHGYDPYKTPEMRAIFYAKGPNIKPGLKIGPFENIHVYPLIAHILGLEIPDNISGRFEVLKEVYKE